MRIGSSFAGSDLTAQLNSLNAYHQLNQSAVRLATMQRINSGRDDPAGLIAVENLRAELTAINQASDNAARAAGMIQVADAALGEVGQLLNTIQGNLVAAAGGGLSDVELEALQIENDAALEAINRIGNITSFGGRKLLDGSGEQTFVFSADLTQTASPQLPHVSTAALGSGAGQLSDLGSGGTSSIEGGNFAAASSILEGARDELLTARARLGAFEKYTIDSSTQVLADMEINLSSALSQINDTDVAAETSRAVQAQILLQATTSSLLLAGQNRSLISGLFDTAG